MEERKMHGWKKLARDTVLLTAASLVMRCIGLSYQVWLAGRIGAAGIGLWQLVMSVNVFTATLAISGVRFTATRLISEELGAEHPGGAVKAVHTCLRYAAVFGFTAFALLYLLSEPIGFLWVRDGRTVASLRILSFTLPMISLSCVLNGYFIAGGAAWKSAVVQITEQVIGVLTVMLLLKSVPENDLSLCCAAISRGNLISSAASLLMIGGFYVCDRKVRTTPPADTPIACRMLRIALPLAVSAYARTGLSTLENLLIPRKLKSAGLSADRAMAGYGTVTGMVFPVIGFPSCLLSAMAELTVPELTAAQVQGDTARIRETVEKLLRIALAYSLLIAGILFAFSQKLGLGIYHSGSAGHYIRIFSLLVPFMYMDIVTDGCLKGLGQMMRSMIYNISESALGVLMVISLLPKLALDGYLIVLFFCEIYNFTLSITRLKKISGFRLLRRIKKARFRKNRA